MLSSDRTFQRKADKNVEFTKNESEDLLLSLGDVRLGVLAVGAVGAGAALLGLAAIRVTLVGNADVVDAGNGHTAEGSGVVVVGVDACYCQ